MVNYLLEEGLLLSIGFRYRCIWLLVRGIDGFVLQVEAIGRFFCDDRVFLRF